MQGYSRSKLTEQGLETIRWATDYMIQCTLPASFGSDFGYVAQVQPCLCPTCTLASPHC